MLWRELQDRWGDYFDGGMGADAIARLVEHLDFDDEEAKLREQIDPPEGVKGLSAQRKQKAIKRLKIVAAFNRRDEYGRRINDPRAMILDVVPVIPPSFVRWSSSMVAACAPPTSTTCTAVSSTATTA